MTVAAKKQEIAQTKTSLPQTQVDQREEIDSSDVILPAIYLMQSNSEWVKDEKVRAGEFARSTSQLSVGGRGKAIEFIPLSFYKSFRIAESNGNKWVRNENWDPAKAQEWEFVEEGKALKRVKCINVYALLVSDILAEQKEKESIAKSGEMFDLEKALTPVLLTFRSSSFKAGKTITDHFARAQQYKAQPFVTRFSLDSAEDTNEKGDRYYVANIVTAGKTAKEHFETCAYWRDLILKGKTKVVESEETTSDESESTQY